MSGVISYILVGTASGCSGAGYVAPNKKQLPLNASEVTRARRLQVVGANTSLPTFQSTKHAQIDYSQLAEIQVGNRLSVPLCKFFNK
jgi:hypothetical protein